MATADSIDSFRSYNQLARQSASAGDSPSAVNYYLVAKKIWTDELDSADAFSDDLQYTYAIVFGGDGSASAAGGSVADYQRGQELVAQGQQNQAREQPSLADVLSDPIGASLTGWFELDQDVHDALGTPKVLAPATELTAAQMRALGLPGAAPQSGRDATTKPPVAPTDYLKAYWWIPAGLAALIVATRG